MKKTFTALLAGLALLLTACMPSPHNTHSLSNPGLTPIGPPAQEAPPIADTVLSDDLIEAALAVCEIFDNHGVSTTLAAIYAVGEGAGLSENDVSALIAVAVVEFCPQHEETISNLY